MKKWIVSAVLYLAVVIAAYGVYTNFIAEDKEENVMNHSSEKSGHGEGHGEEKGVQEESHEEHGMAHVSESEVNVDFQYNEGKINIALTNKENQPVDQLEVNHEKLLHLIVVNEELNQYFHLHPEKLGTGKFQVQKNLDNGSYKAFVDIKPTDLSYEVQPIDFNVGENHSSHMHENKLVADAELKQTIDQYTTVLKMSSKEQGEPVTLDFELDETKLEPYLGAMGHVVILDEDAENYIHVHPADHDKPVFETKFDKPGIYKIWGEFKQDGVVRAFPYVVEIK